MGVGEVAVPAFSLGMVVFAGAITLVLLPLTLFLAGLIFQPRWMIRLVRRRIPHVVFEHVTKERVVALTIDDAPSGDSTHDLLDILRDNDCHATFFIIGSNMDTYPGLVERMWKEGHEVGNHTMHDAPSWRLSPEDFESQLVQVDGKLSKFYRKDEDGPMKWFRPGHGWYTKRMLRVLAKHGYRMALGSVFPYDPLFRHKGRPIAQYLLWKAYPGAIIVLHDRKPQQHQTVEILRRLLPKLKSRGYSVVTLSELMKQ